MRDYGKVTILTVVMAMASGAAFAATDLAKVNGKAITDADLKNALSGMAEGQREGILKDKASRRQLLTNLIDQEVLVQEAEKAKLDQSAEYKEALAAFRRQFLAAKLLEKNLAPQLSEKAAKKYYESNKYRYSTDRARVQHILLSDEGEAKELLKKLKGATVDFQETAEKVSKDPSAKNNRGELGVVTHDSPYVKEFKDAVFDGTEGEIVGPVKTGFGYHLIKIVEKKVGKPMNYDEVELKVKNDFKQEMVETFVVDKKKASKITIDEKNLDKL